MYHLQEDAEKCVIYPIFAFFYVLRAAILGDGVNDHHRQDKHGMRTIFFGYDELWKASLQFFWSPVLFLGMTVLESWQCMCVKRCRNLWMIHLLGISLLRFGYLT